MCGWIRVSNSTDNERSARLPQARLVPDGLQPADPILPDQDWTGDRGEASREPRPARPRAVREATSVGASPSRRAWQRFRRNRLGYWSLVLFCVLVVLSLCAEVLSNDKPLAVRYKSGFYFPLAKDYSEKTFDGDFDTPADYLDPFIREKLSRNGNWAIYPPNPYGPRTINYFAKDPNPSAPSRDNLLGTDDRGRDLLTQLIYGFRLSVLFGLALTVIGVVIGIITGAIQGYAGGKTDLVFQRFMEIWASMPELYLLIIFSAIFAPSVALLLLLLSLFGWMGLSDYVRAEFLRNRQMDYVRAASALGVPPGTPSLGELLNQGKANIDAWWISLSTFAVLVVTLLLLTFMGDALRDALDPRKADK